MNMLRVQQWAVTLHGPAGMLGGAEDIGASAAGMNNTGEYGMTIEGEVMGTPPYMSPEQANGMVAVLDHRSDIYSLGGVLLAMLTLRPPIEGTTLEKVLTRVKSGRISFMITGSVGNACHRQS